MDQNSRTTVSRRQLLGVDVTAAIALAREAEATPATNSGNKCLVRVAAVSYSMPDAHQNNEHHVS